MIITKSKRAQKIALESLAMDLKRVSLGLQRKSFTMVKRFAKEALERKGELKNNDFDSYIKKLLGDLDLILKNPTDSRRAEDILMYSILFQNYSLKKLP